MKTNTFTSVMTFVLLLSSASLFAQLKIHSTGAASIGSTTAPPSGFSLQVTNGKSAFPSGKVMIGTTTDYGAFLNVNNFTYPAAYFNWTSNADWQQSVVTNVDRANSVNYLLKLNGADKFYVRGDGVACALVGFYTWSDRSLKTNITTIDNALDKVLKLRGVTYNLITDNNQTQGNSSSANVKEMGVVAQEVEEVVPEVVKVMMDGKKAVGYQNLVGLLIEAIKDQQAQIDELKDNAHSTSSTLATSNSIDTKVGSEGTKAFLYQNVPNPFSQRTEIKYSIPATAKQSNLYIYNMNGIQLKSFPISEKGEGKIVVEGAQLEAGMYLYSLIIDGTEVETKRMILTK